jgi:2-polyprenyl-3-methyl-5-hydroxy-6-metoxy-1,4-benzoquinol methylase
MQQEQIPEMPALEFDPLLKACPLCSFPSPNPYDRDYRGIAISRCAHCGMKFMNPQYTEAYLAKFYARYIPLDRPFGGGPEHQAMAHQRRVENYAMIERYVPVGRLLSIGCGDGLELKIAQQRGWDAEGYDVDSATTQHLSQALNVKIHTGDLYRLGLPSESYDCVYLDQVIEHPKQPQTMLREVHRLLRPGGVMFIGCPNITSLSSALKTMLERLGLRRRNRGRYYNTEHHLFYYSPRVLRRILERHFGFQVLQIQGDALQHKVNYPNRFYIFLHRRYPSLDSTFQLLAAKQ